MRTSPSRGRQIVLEHPITPITVGGSVVALVVGMIVVLTVGSISLEPARRRAGWWPSSGSPSPSRTCARSCCCAASCPRRSPAAALDPHRPARAAARWRPIWKRDWQSYLRFPLPRLIRMAALGVVAGLSLGAMWRGTIPMIIVAGLALYLGAYDAAEPTPRRSTTRPVGRATRTPGHACSSCSCLPPRSR